MSKELSLLDYCEEEARTTITCGACKEENSVDQEALCAVDVFYQEGWRTRKGICYCPECSKENGLK